MLRTSALTHVSPVLIRAGWILETETQGDINGDGKITYIMCKGDPENIDAQYRTEYSIKL